MGPSQSRLPMPARWSLNPLARHSCSTVRPTGKRRHALTLRVGEVVQVRSAAEIVQTLGENRTLDCLPFMPEMFQFCGKRFRVFKRADKVNDIVDRTGLRRMHDTVLLEDVRCDGSAHGGCQALCQILWKEAWLQRVVPCDETDGRLDAPGPESRPVDHEPCDVNTPEAREAPFMTAPTSVEREVFCCQATEIKKASSFLAWWDVRQYSRDLTSGNVRLSVMLRYLCFWIFTLVSRMGAYRLWIRAYDAFQRVRGAGPYPYRQGRLRSRTPSIKLDLKPGELVEVKSHQDILDTLDVSNKNRGLWFDVEMVKYCGRRYRVLGRVERMVDPKTGRLLTLANDCILLDGVTTRGDYHRFYPQNEYIFWREIWLRRVTG